MANAREQCEFLVKAREYLEKASISYRSNVYFIYKKDFGATHHQKHQDNYLDAPKNVINRYLDLAKQNVNLYTAKQKIVDDYHSLFIRGSIFFYQGVTTQAAELFKQIRLPEDVPISMCEAYHIRYGEICRRLKQDAEAEAHFKKVPISMWGSYNLGILYRDQGRVEKAFLYLSIAVKQQEQSKAKLLIPMSVSDRMRWTNEHTHLVLNAKLPEEYIRGIIDRLYPRRDVSPAPAAALALPIPTNTTSTMLRHFAVDQQQPASAADSAVSVKKQKTTHSPDYKTGADFLMPQRTEVATVNAKSKKEKLAGSPLELRLSLSVGDNEGKHEIHSATSPFPAAGK